MVAGAVGPVVALALIARRHSRCQLGRSQDRWRGAPKQSVITPAIIVLTIFFMLLGLSNAGISNFGVVALMSGYGVTFSAANIALTAFLGASAPACWPAAISPTAPNATAMSPPPALRSTPSSSRSLRRSTCRRPC
jgi:hypothetical protein